jgi:hypothetical protein
MRLLEWKLKTCKGKVRKSCVPLGGVEDARHVIVEFHLLGYDAV